jgi:hypothetical protein
VVVLALHRSLHRGLATSGGSAHRALAVRGGEAVLLVLDFLFKRQLLLLQQLQIRPRHGGFTAACGMHVLERGRRRKRFPKALANPSSPRSCRRPHSARARGRHVHIGVNAGGGCRSEKRAAERHRAKRVRRGRVNFWPGAAAKQVAPPEACHRACRGRGAELEK